MAQTTFNLDKETGEALEQVKVILGVTTNADAFRRMIALTRLNAENADPQGRSYTLRLPDGREMAVPLKF